MEEHYNPFEDIYIKLTVIEKSLAELITLLKKGNYNSTPEYGGIDLAEKITGLAKQTIYQLVSKRKIPYMKKGKRLYFSNTELLDWIRSGRKSTIDEILNHK